MFSSRKSESQFLSSNAQDFIEDPRTLPQRLIQTRFLSSNAQDFIEDEWLKPEMLGCKIPEQ